jgi:mono/diheme cytochrome c family protein
MLLIRKLRHVLLVLPLVVTSARAAAPAKAPAATTAAQQLKRFGEQYCFDCHGAKKQKGDFNFEPFAAKASVLADRKAWEKIAELLESREMPPEGKSQPTEAQRQGLVTWIDSQLAAGESGKMNPGRVTLRRLNRGEYRNTIRDLVGVDFDPVDFPQDETAFGFDTIADALTVQPLLMEKYLSAAEEIVSRLLAGNKQGPPSESFPGDRLKSTGEDVRAIGGGVLAFRREGEGSVAADFRGDGEFTLRFRAYGDQAGPEAPKLAVSLDGKQIAVFDVRNSGKPAPFEVKTTVKGGNHRVTAAYLNNYHEANHPDPKMRGDRNLYVAGFDVVGPLNSKPQPSEGFRRVFSKLPEPGAEAKVARELLASFAARAYRRPVSAKELERIGKVVDGALAEKLAFTETVGVGVQAILCSPSFLFRWELDPETAKPGDIRNLNDYEVASRLSYFLWSSMPDQQLFELAAKGELGKGDNLRREVTRMLADWRSQAFVRNFSTQWLQTRAVDEVEIDQSKFPKFNGKLRESMKEESRLFFEAIVKEDRSIYSLIDADFTYVDQRLAEHYGLPAIQGDRFQRVQLPPQSPRGGVLGQGVVLLATSMPTRTSPVVRGKWVLEQLLGTPPPPAPANVPPLEDAKVDKNAPLRVRLEQHRTNPDCAVCHAKIDPVGFTLENFDAIGAWRTQDQNVRIDASGVFPGGTKVDGVAGLKAYVKSEKFTRAFAQKMMTYALGRGIERHDKAALDAIVRQTSAGGNKMSALITAIVTSDPFLKRKRDVASR